LENNNIASFGRVRVLEDDTLHFQNLIRDQESNINNDSLMLDTYDVYKELRVRGYDYGPKFRGIQEIRNENLYKLYGNIKWTGNWISFMDSILQFMLIAIPFRNVFVPVIITSLRCDPKILFEAIEQNKQMIYDENNPEADIDSEVRAQQFDNELVNDINDDTQTIEQQELAEMKKIMEPQIKQFEELLGTGKEKFISILPVFGDIHMRLAVTRGIELNNVVAVPIPRMNTTQNLKCESYQFIPNEENDVIETTYKKEITEYLQV